MVEHLSFNSVVVCLNPGSTALLGNNLGQVVHTHLAGYSDLAVACLAVV